MPRELIAIAPRTPQLRAYDDPPLGPTQIRIHTEFASPKHGTELVSYRAEPSARRPYDPARGVVMPLPDAPPGEGFPRPLGNMAVGVVTACGGAVTRFRPGDRVFGHFPIRETQTVDEARADPMPDRLAAEVAVCLDPAVMAMAMRDARIGLGDRVAVFGLGAIGLMAVQVARIAGAAQVIAVDPIARRRAVAIQLGADHGLDPLSGDRDPGLAIRDLTSTRSAPDRTSPEPVSLLGGYREEDTDRSDRGVDVAIEVSGSPAALHQAIRATRFGGTICLLSFFGGEATGLRLGEEFHMNRLQIISARAQSVPLRDNPGWSLGRLTETAFAWLVSGRLQSTGIITPVVPFAESAEAYREIDEHPERSIKLGISFP